MVRIKKRINTQKIPETVCLQSAWRCGHDIKKNYHSSIKDFQIYKLRDGNSPSLLFIDGFLSESKPATSRWQQHVQKYFPENAQYYVTWESQSSCEAKIMSERTPVARAAAALAKHKSKKHELDAASISSTNTSEILSNSISNSEYRFMSPYIIDYLAKWHQAIAKSHTTGVLLATLLSRLKNAEFILIGHSLGARVIYYILSMLAANKIHCIKDVYLLGGAVDADDKDGWQIAAKAVRGKIYNCYSKNDWVLNNLYRPASAMLSDPVGTQPISCDSRKIHNHDVSNLVKSHLKYHFHFEKILGELKQANTGDNNFL